MSSTNPFCTSTTGVDKILGEAYLVVKHVDDNLPMLQEVADRIEDLDLIPSQLDTIAASETAADQKLVAIETQGDVQIARVVAQGTTQLTTLTAAFDGQVELLESAGDEQSLRLEMETNANIALMLATEGNRYPDVAAGVTAVAENEYFNVVGNNTNLYSKLYRKVGGVGVAQIGGEISSHQYFTNFMNSGVVIDPDGRATRQQLSDSMTSRLGDLRANSKAFLDGVYGDDTYSGTGSHRGGKKTVAGLLPKTLINPADITKTPNYVGVYQVDITKPAKRPRNFESAIFRNDLGASLGVAQAFNKVNSIEEVDENWPAYWDSDPGARTSTVYFSGFNTGSVEVPVAANPITDGKQYYTQMTPSNEEIISVRTDSVFEGGRSFDPYGGFQYLIGIGQGNLPVFDCRRKLTADAWELSDHPDADGIVYQTKDPIVAEDLIRYLNDPEFSIMMKDTDGKEYPLTIVTSVALCKAKRGTVYFGKPDALDTNANRRMTGAIVFINPRWGKDPTNQGDGTEYRYSYTARAFTLVGSNGATDYTNTHQGQIIERIVCIGGADGQGPIENDDTVYRQIVSEWGGKHSLTIENGLVENCILWGIRGGANGGDIPMQGFATNPAGQDLYYNGLTIVSPDHWRWAGNGLYCHGNVGTDFTQSHYINRFISYNGWGIVTTSRKTYMNDLVFLNGPITRYATTLAELNTAAALDAPADRQVDMVTQYDGGNRGPKVWRADLDVPAYETLSWGGKVQANAPNVDNLGVETYIRRALFNQILGGGIVAPAGPPEVFLRI